MRIYRPTLYVGLGGTGCRVGAELERGLREHFPPDQLPSRVQFLYADLNENDLPAAAVRIRLATSFGTCPEVARSLCQGAAQSAVGWLPPPPGEPLIGPLALGACQLPAVGRTALFETLRERPSAVRIPLPSEIVTKSLPCNVFVAFSVAGGTGGGVFLDFLRLIADAFALEDLHVRI
ncbi:hypothetical protein GCM10022267_66660 [Lentzea roselyniae]|uniref:Tubulin/FtsZ GTPase domain-containing protein n=1 Tax=Lentzea roselyniae TaxID=531940 RepID=A0ABP7BWV7_9PSEU